MVCLCAHGIRSSRAAQYLRLKEIEAQNLLGGVEKWNEVLKDKEGGFESGSFSANNIDSE